MKRLFTLALLAVGLWTATTAHAQGSLKFGLKGGLNVTDMHLSSEVFDAKNQAGWFIGPTIKLALPIVGLSVDGAALYDYRSAKVTNELSEEETVKQQSINIPINLRYGVGLGSTASVFFFAGPQFGFNVGDDEFKWNSGSSYQLKKSNFSVNLGLGVSVLRHLEVSANYNIACGKTADVNVLKTPTDAIGQAIGLKSKSRNNSWQIALAYYF